MRCIHWFAVYLWRVFEAVRRRLVAAFFASISSVVAPPGLGGLLPNMEPLAGTGCSILSSRSCEYEHHTKGQSQHHFCSCDLSAGDTNCACFTVFLWRSLEMVQHSHLFGYLLSSLFLSFLLFSSLDFSHDFFFLHKQKKSQSTSR